MAEEGRLSCLQSEFSPSKLQAEAQQHQLLTQLLELQAFAPGAGTTAAVNCRFSPASPHPHHLPVVLRRLARSWVWLLRCLCLTSHGGVCGSVCEMRRQQGAPGGCRPEQALPPTALSPVPGTQAGLRRRQSPPTPLGKSFSSWGLWAPHTRLLPTGAASMESRIQTDRSPLAPLSQAFGLLVGTPFLRLMSWVISLPLPCTAAVCVGTLPPPYFLLTVEPHALLNLRASVSTSGKRAFTALCSRSWHENPIKSCT